ncbi:FAD-dependent monooxygenase [Streptomyces sp. NPDC046197]|uniref:FAD-dependent monooxygenase n=1 Tax=Streptomyces sp. NPDC046197 TaxID=3154337 RepID=UPI0033ED2114
MPVPHAEVGVLIVGAGPVGLTARALLERWGVRALLVEKRRELSPFPRSRPARSRAVRNRAMRSMSRSRTSWPTCH